MAADYFARQCKDADGLAAELDTPEKRRRYIATFYGPRFWAAPGAFTREDVDFLSEPFADADQLSRVDRQLRVRRRPAPRARDAAPAGAQSHPHPRSSTGPTTT